MTTVKPPFTTLDVFTETRYVGNPLAIVRVPASLSASLSQSQKQAIARESNLSETVFLHEPAAEESHTNSVKIDIFTTTEELPFAGHPTVGTGWLLLSREGAADQVTLRTKAGDIPVTRDGARVRLRVPTDFKIHAPLAHTHSEAWDWPSTQPSLSPAADFAAAASAVASIVKGMTFVLLQLTSEDALARMRPFPARFALPDAEGYLGAWDGLVGVYAYAIVGREGDTTMVRTRLFDGALEDPATGSAASALAGYLATHKGEGVWRFVIVQGVEMGRRSEISVLVRVGAGGDIVEIQLAGSAVETMEGHLST